MQVQVFPPTAQFSDPEDFRAVTALFFSRVDAEMLDRALADTKPGRAFNGDALFVGDDARWRLLRPLQGADNPDAFVIAPAQTQYLIRPPGGSVFSKLVLVGLPDADADMVTQPAIAGELGPRAGPRAGLLFTLEPKQPETCTIAPDQAAKLTQGILTKHLKFKS